MSPLGDAIVALILTIVIGWAVGFVLALIGQLLIAYSITAEFDRTERMFHRRLGSAGLRVDEEPRAGKIPKRLGLAVWVLAILVWIVTLCLVVARIIDVVQVATS